MANARKAVLDRLADLSWSKSRLAELCHERAKMSRTTIHEWLGKKRDITSSNLDIVLAVLGMDYSVISKLPSADTRGRKPALAKR